MGPLISQFASFRVSLANNWRLPPLWHWHHFTCIFPPTISLSVHCRLVWDIISAGICAVLQWWYCNESQTLKYRGFPFGIGEHFSTAVRKVTIMTIIIIMLFSSWVRSCAWCSFTSSWAVEIVWGFWCYWRITDRSDVNDQNQWLVYQWADTINQARGTGWGGQEEDVIPHLSGDGARRCVDRVGRKSVNEPEDTSGN